MAVCTPATRYAETTTTAPITTTHSAISTNTIRV
jgi:hypothetical protein